MTQSRLVARGFVVVLLAALPAVGPDAQQPPASITTPDKVESRLGTLDFKDGAPSQATMDKVYDHLDFTHAFEAFVNTAR